MERLKIEMSSEDILELWNLLYFDNSEADFEGEKYKNIQKINTSDYSDGPSWDYIIQRQSDGKFFKFNIWESSKGYIVEDEYLEEVFPKTVVKIEYE
jgi:hypothetical protein